MSQMPFRPTIRMRGRFNPHVLVVLIFVLVIVCPLREAVGAFVWWKYSSTYQRRDFIVTQEQPVDSLVRGLLIPQGMTLPADFDPDGAESVAGGELWVMAAVTVDGVSMFAEDHAVPATRGSRTAVWWSPDAPSIGYGSRASNIALVSAKPELPGITPFLGWLAVLVALAWLGSQAVAWAAKRWRPRTFDYDNQG